MRNSWKHTIITKDNTWDMTMKKEKFKGQSYQVVTDFLENLVVALETS